MNAQCTDGFWHLRAGADTHIACCDGSGYSMTYAELRAAVGRVASTLLSRGSRQLGVLLCSNTPEWLLAYLGALTAGHVPLLLPQDTPTALLEPLVKTYGPDWVWRGSATVTPRTESSQICAGACASFQASANPLSVRLHPDLGCLLSTSGSTGSPKLVRLSYRALDANARSIAEYLEIGPDERALTTLPGSYSYGLSVINSHLSAGATVVLKTVSLISREFVETVRAERVTSLAGVPSWYQMLLRTGFDKADTPSLRTLTQAGGKLDERTKRTVLDVAERKGIRFFVMYGQTEATARMSYVPPELLRDHMDSIGKAIPGGQMTLDHDTSEIIYQGPNVMMGYAESASDLVRPDDCGGVLKTGDLGTVDEAGFFKVTGRLKRFVKLSGNRYGLDEIEAALFRQVHQPIAVTGRDERLGVFVEGVDSEQVELVKSCLSKTYGLHHSLFRVVLVEQLPLLPSGKRDYADLLKRLG